MIALYIIMVFCISCRQLCSLLYVLNAVVSCFVHLMCPKQLPIAFFLSPLLLSLLLALIKVACVAVLFFQRCVPQFRQGHSFLQCARCRKRGYGFAFAFSLTELILWIISIERNAMAYQARHKDYAVVGMGAAVLVSIYQCSRYIEARETAL